MTAEKEPNGELLEIKSKNHPKGEVPKPKPVNKGTNDLETN